MKLFGWDLQVFHYPPCLEVCYQVHGSKLVLTIKPVWHTLPVPQQSTGFITPLPIQSCNSDLCHDTCTYQLNQQNEDWFNSFSPWLPKISKSHNVKSIMIMGTLDHYWEMRHFCTFQTCMPTHKACTNLNPFLPYTQMFNRESD